jgi:hypothetical protein
LKDGSLEGYDAIEGEFDIGLLEIVELGKLNYKRVNILYYKG